VRVFFFNKIPFQRLSREQIWQRIKKNFLLRTIDSLKDGILWIRRRTCYHKRKGTNEIIEGFVVRHIMFKICDPEEEQNDAVRKFADYRELFRIMKYNHSRKSI